MEDSRMPPHDFDEEPNDDVELSLDEAEQLRQWLKAVYESGNDD